MWHWLKRWRDWAASERFLAARRHPHMQPVHYSYEKAGLTLPGQPIPWNAEAVVVEALLRLEPNHRRKTDFTLRLPGREPVPADTLRRDEASQADNRHRLFFRFPPPPQTTIAQVVWRDSHVLGSVNLPVLGHDEFLQALKLEVPTVFARLGEQAVACQTFVATQCRGLLASAVITAPTSLAPLADLGVQVEFRSERDGATQLVPVPLSSTQLSGRRALLSAAPRKSPRKMGSWSVTWLVAGRPLAMQRVKAISLRTFQRSLRVSDTRFVVGTKEGVELRRQVPPLAEARRVGPCFLVSSREPGMAGLCTLRVCAQVPGAEQAPTLLEQPTLITDGPTMFAPGTLDTSDLGQLAAFELRLKSHVLGVLSLCPVPAASFTAEGGFKPAGDFLWSGAADEELSERLGRLMNGDGRN
jgi:hypothetical protein